MIRRRECEGKVFLRIIFYVPGFIRKCKMEIGHSADLTGNMTRYLKKQWFSSDFSIVWNNFIVEFPSGSWINQWKILRIICDDIQKHIKDRKRPRFASFFGLSLDASFIPNCFSARCWMAPIAIKNRFLETCFNMVELMSMKQWRLLWSSTSENCY